MNPLYPNNQMNYQNNQKEQICKAAKALGDYIDAAKQVDGDHQVALLLACLFTINAKAGW